MKTNAQFQRRFEKISGIVGFTLTELLLAAAIMCSAVTLGGAGLSAIISSSTAVNEGNERQDELNRALDFISAEIREAQTINHSSIDPTVAISPNASIKAGTIEPIMWLDMANIGDVFYYLAEPVDANTPWRGKKVVYRWGPEFDENGRYKQDGTPPSHSVLIDSLRDDIDSQSVSCPSSWTKFPSAGTNVGFYACVEDSNKVASLLQVGQVDLVLEKSKPMLKERQTYSRSSDTVGLDSGAAGSTPPPPEVSSDDEVIRTASDRYVVMIELEELRLSHMGGAITCGPGGPTVPTQVTAVFEKPNGDVSTADIGLGSVTKTDVPKGTSISFRAKRQAIGNCGEYTVDSRFDLGTQILALGDGESIPYYDPFDNQEKIDGFLSDYLLDEKISIDKNQKVFLFEVGESYSSNPGPAYDFQDIVLLADVTPKRKRTEITVKDGVIESSETVESIERTVQTADPLPVIDSSDSANSELNLSESY